jgi:NADH:ubiquinone oxidoreductase subunit 6 (subunit J)
VQELGAYLFNNQLVNLELAGLILTVAMIGAIVIARGA